MGTIRPGNLAKPRWDGSRIIFQAEADGGSVACAISRGALEDLSGRRHIKSAELLQCFASVRPRVEAIVAGKLHARGEGVTGMVSIWSDDIEDIDDPPAAPAVAQQADSASGD